MFPRRSVADPASKCTQSEDVNVPIDPRYTNSVYDVLPEIQVEGWIPFNSVRCL
jgi:hypothetical protein